MKLMKPMSPDNFIESVELGLFISTVSDLCNLGNALTNISFSQNKDLPSVRKPSPKTLDRSANSKGHDR